MTRGIWPREYGAYAELAFPLLTGFLLGGATPAGVAFAMAAACGFLVNEPLSVLNGLRGHRVREELGDAARRRARLVAAVGAVAAGAGFALAPDGARLAALVPGAFAAMLVPAMLRGQPKRLAAEIVMAAAFAAMTGPVALAGDTDAGQAALAAGVWFVNFALATLAVHGIKAQARPDLAAPWTARAAPALALCTIGGAAVAIADGAPRAAALGVLPTALIVLVATIVRAHPRHLRRVGWSLVVGNAVTVALLLGA